MRGLPIAVCLVAAFLAAACGENVVTVGRVEVEPGEIRLLYPGFSEYRLVWEADTVLEGRQGDLRASVHLIGSGGEVLRTFDHAIAFEWSPGTSASAGGILYQSVLGPPLEEGTYRLTFGLYDAAGNSWEVSSSGATVRVVDSMEGFPAFYFSPEWQPIEGGTDRQILGRRWLRADGVLRLGELTQSGTLWLQIAIPSPIEGDQELELDEGAAEPEVVVHNSCGDLSETRRGSGSHQLMLSIIPPEDETVPPECEIRIDANYALIAVRDRVRRTVALESLSWLTD